MSKIEEAKQLVKEISEKQHELFKESKLVGLLRAYQIAIEVAEKAAKEKFDIKDFEKLSDEIFGVN